MYKSGDKYFSTYEETGSAMNQFIDDYYNDMLSFAKSEGGVAGYGYRPNTGYLSPEHAYFNAYMGKEITSAMYSCDNIYTAMGSRPYAHEGVRIAYELASYGMTDATNATAMGLDTTNATEGEEFFVGAGAGITQEGNIGPSFTMPLGEFREPWKELDFAFDYGLGLQALEHKDDDTIQYKAYAEKMAMNFSDLIDRTLQRPIYMRQPLGKDIYGNTVETSLNSIYRCIASGSEVGAEYTVNGRTYTIDEDHITPFGGAGARQAVTGATGQVQKSDFETFRGNNAGTQQAHAHTENALDGQVINLEGGVMQLGDLKKLKMLCQVNWSDMANPNNKAIIVSPVIQYKLGALMLANNVHLGQEYASKDFNGVKLMPGREAGYNMNTFEGLPLLMDGNVAFNFTTRRPSAIESGPVTILDFDHIWMSTVTPIELFTVNNPLLNTRYQERNLMHMRCETRIDSFMGSGRIVNIANDS
jgi:hypothetical protein